MADLVELACAFATASHAVQKRKYDFQPYIVHPAAVVDILVAVGVTDPPELAAAWLHDVVEDCEVPIWRIERTFGYDVAQLVATLTDPPTVKGGPNREQRKASTRKRFETGDPRAHDIKCADCLDNGKSIAAGDPKFAETYFREISLLLPVLNRANPKLQSMVHFMLEQYEREQLDLALAEKSMFNGN